MITYIKSAISAIKTDLKSLGVVPQNLALAENLGILLLSLILLVSIATLMVVTFILSLLSLAMMILKKLLELLMSIGAPGSSVRYILCRLGDVPKNTILMLKKLQRRVWKEDGVSPQGSTYPYSEMHGVHDKVDKERKEQLSKAMKAPIDMERLRQKGF